VGERETLQELVNDFEQRQKEAESVASACADIDDNDGFVDNQIIAGVWSRAASIVEAKMNAKSGGS
jgi:hypothetical protein